MHSVFFVDINIILLKGLDIMVNYIVISIITMVIWLVTMHIFKESFEYDDDVSKENTIESIVKVIAYTSYKRYGILLANYNGAEFEFRDYKLRFSEILESNIGNYVTLTFISRIEGILIFNTSFYIIGVSERRKQYDNWL